VATTAWLAWVHRAMGSYRRIGVGDDELIALERRFEPLLFERFAGGTLLFSPDAMYVVRERWESIPVAEREGFAALCPDAAFEMLSILDVG
jgi:Uma2 family endonuclease